MIFGLKIGRLKSQIHEYQKTIRPHEYFFVAFLIKEIKDSDTPAKRTGEANTTTNKVK
jgi:hypothetical protein